MYQRIRLILLLILIGCIHYGAYGQKVNYQQFDNIYLGAEASVISCFLQDSEGLIWIGSNKGLFSYDGYSTQICLSTPYWKIPPGSAFGSAWKVISSNTFLRREK